LLFDADANDLVAAVVRRPVRRARCKLSRALQGSSIQEKEMGKLSDTPMGKRCFAEFLGTFWLVLGGCGSAVLAAAFPQLGIGFAGVALAFGLTVVTMAYAVGHISGGHFNPAVTVGLWAGGRIPSRDILPYVVSQVLGGIVAGAVLYLIASGKTGFDPRAGFASNGYGLHSPGGYSLLACMVSEFVLTAFFLIVIHGVTDKRAPAGFAPLAIGLALTLIHLISIPVTNTSVNPARSTGAALFQGTWAIAQLWMFWLVPLAGGIAGGLIYRCLAAPDAASRDTGAVPQVPTSAA
jgi:aquaporin Z